MKSFKDIQKLNRAVREDGESLSEANSNKPGKPETMADRHWRLSPEGKESPSKEFAAWIKEVLKDWKSGDMTLARMESVVGHELHNRMVGGYWGDPPDLEYSQALQKAYVKAMKAAGVERIGRLGWGSGLSLRATLPRITPNEIAAFMEAFIKFCQTEWAALDKKFGK